MLQGETTRRLEIDRWWQGQDRRTHQIMAAHVPMICHPEPQRVLVVGVGAGQTPARFLMYDVDGVDCVDIEPGVLRAHREPLRRVMDARSSNASHQR